MQRPFSGRMDKTHIVPEQDWVLAHNSKTGDYFGQVFDRKLVDKIGLWEGHNFFTMELIFKRLLMSPGEKKNFTIYYVPGTGDLQTAIRSLKEFKPASGK
jgi:hypothetical protein